MKSIIQNEKRCYLCYKTQGLERHHVFFGTKHRASADKYGLTVWLCGETCHRTGQYAAHQNRLTDLMLKQKAQEVFEARYSHEKFMEVFGKSYI